MSPEESFNATSVTESCSDLTITLLMRFFVLLWCRCKRKVDQLIECDTIKWPTVKLKSAAVEALHRK